MTNPKGNCTWKSSRSLTDGRRWPVPVSMSWKLPSKVSTSTVPCSTRPWVVHFPPLTLGVASKRSACRPKTDADWWWEGSLFGSPDCGLHNLFGFFFINWKFNQFTWSNQGFRLLIEFSSFKFAPEKEALSCSRESFRSPITFFGVRYWVYFDWLVMIGLTFRDAGSQDQQHVRRLFRRAPVEYGQVE